jgi:hypothetical protein
VVNYVSNHPHASTYLLTYLVVTKLLAYLPTYLRKIATTFIVVHLGFIHNLQSWMGSPWMVCRWEIIIQVFNPVCVLTKGYSIRVLSSKGCFLRYILEWSNSSMYNNYFAYGVFALVHFCLALPIYQGKDIVFRFIIEYSSLRDFGPLVIIIGLFFIWGLLKDNILACVETWD